MIRSSLLTLLVACNGKDTNDDSGSDTDTDTDTGEEIEPLEFAPCGSMECATLTVPAVAGEQGGDTFDLYVTRRPARVTEDRIGVLVVNMGGPGLAFADFLDEWMDWVTSVNPEIADRFDVVTWDPRGVGLSEPAIDCTGGDLDFLERTVWTATTDDERDDRQQSVDRFVDGCLARTSDALLEHAGTLDNVDDMERLRIALGEEQLNFLGFSYGTLLGSHYAVTYPDRVRAFVLDSVAGGQHGDPCNITAAESQEEVLDELFFECFTYGGPEQCPITEDSDTSPDDVAARYDAWVEEVREAPISAGVAPPVTYDQLKLTVQSALYNPGNWPSWSERAKSGMDGDGSGLAEIAASYWGEGSLAVDAFMAITALDWDHTTLTSADIEECVGVVEPYAPRVADMGMGFSYLSAEWPIAPNRPLEDIGPTDAPPLLVVGVEHDPATPYANAVDLVDQLDNGSFLLTYDGYGHSATWQLSPCVTNVARDFFLDPTATPSETTCHYGE